MLSENSAVPSVPSPVESVDECFWHYSGRCTKTTRVFNSRKYQLGGAKTILSSIDHSHLLSRVSETTHWWTNIQSLWLRSFIDGSGSVSFTNFTGGLR